MFVFCCLKKQKKNTLVLGVKTSKYLFIQSVNMSCYLVFLFNKLLLIIKSLAATLALTLLYFDKNLKQSV